MSASTTVFLVRHGATVENEGRPVVLQGIGLDGPLSETGRQQAAGLASVLARFAVAAVYASPLRRAQETAAAVAELHALPVHTEPALHEIDVGRWEGLTWQEVMQQHPDHYRRFMEDPAKVPHLGGESYGDGLRRTKPVLERLLAKHAGETIVLAAHKGVNRSLLADLLGIAPRRAKGLRQSNCCINVLRAREGTCEVATFNATLELLTASPTTR